MVGAQTGSDHLQRSHEIGWGFLGETGLVFLHHNGLKMHKVLKHMAAADLSTDVEYVEWAAVTVQLLTVLT